MPYHLLKREATKGLLIILGFIGAYLGAWWRDFLHVIAPGAR
jgi:hypothetical protein